MSPKTHTRRRSAATSCSRIEFVPSRRAAAIWLGWLALSGWLASQARLPWQLRVLIILLVLAIAGRTLWSYVCLRGARAVRALEWSAGEQTLYYVCLGPAGRRLPAIPDGCRRYGEAFWLLRFRTAESVVQLPV